ncbi:hypothetical protein D3C87_1368120 [compost metagenome]
MGAQGRLDDDGLGQVAGDGVGEPDGHLDLGEGGGGKQRDAAAQDAAVGDQALAVELGLEAGEEVADGLDLAREAPDAHVVAHGVEGVPPDHQAARDVPEGLRRGDERHGTHRDQGDGDGQRVGARQVGDGDGDRADGDGDRADAPCHRDEVGVDAPARAPGQLGEAGGPPGGEPGGDRAAHEHGERREQVLGDGEAGGERAVLRLLGNALGLGGRFEALLPDPCELLAAGAGADRIRLADGQERLIAEHDGGPPAQALDAQGGDGVGVGEPACELFGGVHGALSARLAVAVADREDGLAAHQDGLLRRLGAGGQREDQGGGEGEARKGRSVQAMAHVLHLS